MNRLALAAALLCAAPSAQAHDKKEHKDGKPRPEMADRMKEKLGLSDAQAEKMKAAMSAHADALKPLRERVRETLKKLREQVKAGAKDADLKATLDQLKAGRKSMQAAQEKLAETLAGVLTPMQQAKMALGLGRGMREGGMSSFRQHRMKRGGREGDDEEGPHEKADEGDDD